MHVSISRFVFGVVASLTILAAANASAEDAKWTSLFDGTTLEGWAKVGNEKSVWEVADGAINGSGPA